MPQSLLRIRNLHTCQRKILHLAKHLRSLDQRIGHHKIPRIPQRRTRPRSEQTQTDLKTVHMPKGYFPQNGSPRPRHQNNTSKPTPRHGQSHPPAADPSKQKRTFTAEFLITDNIHNLFIHLIYIAKLLKSQKTQTGHHSSTHIAAGHTAKLQPPRHTPHTLKNGIHNPYSR